MSADKKRRIAPMEKPIKQDGRKNNGGHKNAGRKPIKNPKRTGSMRLSDDDWLWLDDPANGKSRGEIVSRFIAEKRRITPWVNENLGSPRG